MPAVMPAVMPVLQPVFCASFPRSGCTYFHDCLRAVIGPELRRCEIYQEEFDPLRHNMLKSHDFGLDDGPGRRPGTEGWATVVQIRHPFDALPSWFSLEVGMKTVPDSREDWEAWALRAAVFWRRWTLRWVFSERTVLTIRHEDLMRAPTVHTSVVAGILTGRVNLSSNFSIPSRPAQQYPAPPMLNPGDVPSPRMPTSHRGFRYFDPQDRRALLTFERIAAICAPEMGALGYSTSLQLA